MKAYAEKIQKRRDDEQRAREDKIAEKMRRKAEREAKKKAEEIARLREEIKEKFIEKVVPVDEILKQEFTEIDGWEQDGKPVVTALGGFLGQLMLVLNTVAKYYPQLDRPSKSVKSGASRPKSRTSQKSGNKSARSNAEEDVTSTMPRQVLNPQVVQNFIYIYVNEKLKSEKLALQVDSRFEKFLNNLANPLQLNEMRTMKEGNYETIRDILDKYMGSPVLKLIKEHQEELGLDPDIFSLVYDGFWDLYTFHPAIKDVSARKLQMWIQKIRLQSSSDPSGGAEEAAGEEEPAAEGEEEAKAAKVPPIDLAGEEPMQDISAVVRVKIPKVPREPELDDEGNEIVDNVEESDLEDIPFEDKCLSVTTKLEAQNIWVINHLAQKTLRADLSAEFRGLSDRLDHLDTIDFNFRLEKEAAAFEEAFLKLFEEDAENTSKAPRVPVFDFRPTYQ